MVEKTSVGALRNQFDRTSRFLKPNNYGVEGSDHINIGLNSSSVVGRILSTTCIYNFEYPGLGNFASVYNLWSWLRAGGRDDKLRHALLNDCRLRLAELEANGIALVSVDHFKAIIGHATWLKAKNCMAFCAEAPLVRHMDLLCYTYSSDLRVRVTAANAAVITAIGRRIVNSVANGVEASFERFCTQGVPHDKHYLNDRVRRQLLGL